MLEKKQEEEIKKEKNIITGAMEKIGILEKKVETETKETKTLNQRIEDLVNQMEKINDMIKNQFSFKAIFLKGLLQGLGIVIGSTVLAGLLYSVTVKFIDEDFIKKNTLEYILDKSVIKK